MSWARFDDAFWSHPKTLRAGNEAVGAFVRMVCYCAQHLTDGALDADTALSIAGRPKVLAALVAVGFLERVGEAFQVHDYLDRNHSRAQISAERDAKIERQSRWRSKQDPPSRIAVTTAERANGDASLDASRDASTTPSRDASVDRLSRSRVPSHPIPSHPEGEKEKKRAEREEGAGTHTHEGASAHEAPTGDEPTPPIPSKSSKKAPARRQPTLPRADVPPKDGTPAKALYSLILLDENIRPILKNPGEWSSCVTDPEHPPYPGVSVVDEVRKALLWLKRGTRAYVDGRAFLENWLRRAQEGQAKNGSPAKGPAPMGTNYAPLENELGDD